MNGPVAQALSARPEFEANFTTFRSAAHMALGEDLTALVRRAVAQVHGLEVVSDDHSSEAALGDERVQACLAYARRMPFEHTAITDEEAAAVVEALGEPGYVALSVVAALADAECRATMVDLPGLAR